MNSFSSHTNMAGVVQQYSPHLKAHYPGSQFLLRITANSLFLLTLCSYSIQLDPHHALGIYTWMCILRKWRWRGVKWLEQNYPEGRNDFSHTVICYTTEGPPWDMDMRVKAALRSTSSLCHSWLEDTTGLSSRDLIWHRPKVFSEVDSRDNMLLQAPPPFFLLLAGRVRLISMITV